LFLTFTSYGTVPFSILTFVKFFLALFIAFDIESTTSQDLPVPRPTLPLPSPITTTALNLNCLPQAVTLVTLSIASNSSLNSFFCSVELFLTGLLLTSFLSVQVIKNRNLNN
jgi:hypothetical protein